MFCDLQNFQRDRIVRNFEAISLKDQVAVDFWSYVAKQFSINRVLDNGSFNAPCHYVQDSPSLGRHRQHCYITDKDGTLFQLDAMFHKEYLGFAPCELPLGALLSAMLKGDVTGADDWFDDFSNYANKKLFSSLKCLVADIEDMPSLAVENIKTFYSDFFFWNVYSFESSISNYHYDGMPPLGKLLDISKNITVDTISDFKDEVYQLTK